jgi:hypothetical protein
MEKKQTAVKWLEKLFYTHAESAGIDNDKWVIKEEDLDKLFEQAKEMEKEQIMDAFEIGYENGACVNDEESIYHGGNYYNKTYKSE